MPFPWVYSSVTRTRLVSKMLSKLSSSFYDDTSNKFRFTRTTSTKVIKTLSSVRESKYTFIKILCVYIYSCFLSSPSAFRKFLDKIIKKDIDRCFQTRKKHRNVKENVLCGRKKRFDL